MDSTAFVVNDSSVFEGVVSAALTVEGSTAFAVGVSVVFLGVGSDDVAGVVVVIVVFEDCFGSVEDVAFYTEFVVVFDEGGKDFSGRIAVEFVAAVEVLLPALTAYANTTCAADSWAISSADFSSSSVMNCFNPKSSPSTSEGLKTLSLEHLSSTSKLIS